MKKILMGLLLFTLFISVVFADELTIAVAPDDIIQISGSSSANWFQTFKSPTAINVTALKFYVNAVSGTNTFDIILYDNNQSTNPLASISGNTGDLQGTSFNTLPFSNVYELQADIQYWVLFNVTGDGYVDFGSTYYNNYTDGDCWYKNGGVFETCSPFGQSDFTMSLIYGCIVPTNGMVITEDTKLCQGTYNLPNGIELYGSNIQLDCDGATLIGSDIEDSMGVVFNGTGGDWNAQTVKNCHIQDYYYGISARPSLGGSAYTGTKVLNNTLTSNVRKNLNFGIAQETINDIEIADNDFGETQMPNQYGFHLDQVSSGVIIHNNYFRKNSGILHFGRSESWGWGTQFYNNRVEGVRLMNIYNDVLFYNNSFNWTNTNQWYQQNIYVMSNTGTFYKNDFYGGLVYELYGENTNTWCVNSTGNRFFKGTTGGASCPTPDPVRHYAFDEVSGTVADDVGTQNVDGIFDTGVILNQEGRVGKSVLFDIGSMNNAEGVRFLMTGLNLSAERSFTVSFWIKNVVSNPYFDVSMFPVDWLGSYTNGYPEPNFEFIYQRCGACAEEYKGHRFMARPNYNDGWEDIFSTSTRANQEWELVTLSYSKEDRAMRMYVNGNQETTTSTVALGKDGVIDWVGGNPTDDAEYGGFTVYLNQATNFYLDDYQIYTDVAMDGRQSQVLYENYPPPAPIIETVTNSTTSSTITLTFTYSETFDYVEWYIDGVLDGNFSGTTHQYQGLTPDQPYNVSFKVINTGGEDYWEGIITPTALPPIILSVSNSTTPTSIDLSFTYTNQLDYVEWYIDGVMDANNSDTSHTYSGLTTEQPYNVSFIVYNIDGSAYWEGFITPQQAPCVVPTSHTLYQNGEFHFCEGEYGSVIDLQIGDNAKVYFHPNGTLISGYGDPINEDGVINMVGDNALLDCGGMTRDRGVTGATENDGSGMIDGEGTRGINFWGDANNNTIQNCWVFHNKFNVFTWIDVSDNKFINISLDDSMYSGFHGGGNNAYLYNVNAINDDLFMLGYNQHIENSMTTQNLGLGHPDGCCTQAKWSGDIINGDFTEADINFLNVNWNDPFNISFNQVRSIDNIIGGNNGQQYIYGNTISGQVQDYTDWGAGEYVTYCVDGVGNTYTQEQGNGYNGGDPDFGTCPAIDCSVEFVTGCKITQDVTLPYGEYNVKNIFTATGNTPSTLDCQGSTINGDFEGTGTEQSNFIRVNDEWVTVKNCNFRKFFSISESNRRRTTYDNISWIEYNTDFYQDCPECGDPYDHPPTFFKNDRSANRQTIQNSYFEGEVSMNLYRDFNYYRGDYCPDTSNNYVLNSDNCFDWQYTYLEEDCKPDMWNADLQRCEDSRGVWNGGNCNQCNVDWQWYDGWYGNDGCNYGFTETWSYPDTQYNLFMINNVINKSNSALNGDMLDRRFPTAYGIDTIQIVNNTYIGSENPNTMSDYFVRLSGNTNVLVTGNRFLMGKYYRGLNIFAHEWQQPMCPNTNVEITDNYFEAERSFADGGFSWSRNGFSGVYNGLIQGNTYNATPNSDRIIVWMNPDAWDTDLINVTITNNNFLYDNGYDIYQSIWAEHEMQNIDIYGNQFSSLIIGDRLKGWDTKLYNNIIRGTLYVEDSKNPYTGSQVDICNGVGNTYLGAISYEQEDGYGSEELPHGLWLDPACDPMNVPEGISLYSYDNTPPTINLFGSGVTLIGNSGVGVFADNVNQVETPNGFFGNIKIQGYPVSMNISSALTYNNLENIEADACVYAEGVGTTRTNVTDNCICIEDWDMINNPCTNSRKKPILYHDRNECGTTINLPANNGTMQVCIPEYNATHQSSDIAGVTVDTIVETGAELIQYTPLIAVGGIAGYLLFLI